jgi:hypothetical protein
MGSYGSGRKAIYESTERYHTINVKNARAFGYGITYSEQKNVTGKRAWIICPCCQRRCGKLGGLPLDWGREWTEPPRIAVQGDPLLSEIGVG